MEQEKKLVQVKLEALEAQLRSGVLISKNLGLRRTKPRTRRKPSSRAGCSVAGQAE